MILELFHSSVVPNAPLLLILPIKAPETPALSDDVKPANISIGPPNGFPLWSQQTCISPPSSSLFYTIPKVMAPLLPYPEDMAIIKKEPPWEEIKLQLCKPTPNSIKVSL
jgi:hypothetical protein